MARCPLQTLGRGILPADDGKRGGVLETLVFHTFSSCVFCIFAVARLRRRRGHTKPADRKPMVVFLCAYWVILIAHACVRGCPGAVGGLLTATDCAAIQRHEFPPHADFVLSFLLVTFSVIASQAAGSRGPKAIRVATAVYVGGVVGLCVALAPWAHGTVVSCGQSLLIRVMTCFTALHIAHNLNAGKAKAVCASSPPPPKAISPFASSSHHAHTHTSSSTCWSTTTLSRLPAPSSPPTL